MNTDYDYTYCPKEGNNVTIFEFKHYTYINLIFILRSAEKKNTCLLCRIIVSSAGFGFLFPFVWI